MAIPAFLGMTIDRNHITYILESARKEAQITPPPGDARHLGP